MILRLPILGTAALLASVSAGCLVDDAEHGTSAGDLAVTPQPVQFPNIADIGWSNCDVPDDPPAYFAKSVPACPAGDPNCLQKVELDTAVYPDAVCNDGSPGVMYVRPAPAGSPDADKWVVHLQGGGACAGLGDCVVRWCGDDYHDAAKMSSYWTPDQIDDRGIARATSNNFGDWNQVFMYYCSSDQWLGRGNRLFVGNAPGHEPDPVHPITEAVVPFHGYDILYAAFETLRTGGLQIGNATLADLDHATHVLLSGSSAGGMGARYLADAVRAGLRSTNPGLAFRLVVDAAVKPIEAWVTDQLDLPYDDETDDEFQDLADYTAQHHDRALIWNSFIDSSCLAHHPTDPETCSNPDHLLFNHVTTPFFVRQDLSDRMSDDADPALWTAAAADHLYDLLAIQSTAEEGAAITVVPGAFGPDYDNHVGIENTAQFFNEDITPPTINYHDTLWNWLNGVPDGFVIQP